jgi:hypothetical protein
MEINLDGVRSGFSIEDEPEGKDRLSTLRRQAAKETKIGEIVALEAADDAEGFGFWLARVVVPAWYNYSKTAVKKDGVTIKPKGYYINVKIIDRFPVDSPTTYRLLPIKGTRLDDRRRSGDLAQRRGRGGHGCGATPYALEPAEEQGRVHTNLQPLRARTRAVHRGCRTLDANGGHKHQDKAPAEQLLARNRNG